MAGIPGQASTGRPPKSTQQHDLDGTRRSDRHGSFETPDPPRNTPEPPKELEGDALDEWHRMVWRLEQSKSLTTVDDAAVYQYCRLFAETEGIALQQEEAKASLRILEENRGDLKELDASERQSYFGNLVTLQKLISKCTDQLRSGRLAIRSYLVEFGMTPAARSRVKIPKGADKPKNKWDGVLPA